MKLIETIERCEKLVTEFDWNKDYVPPKFEFEDERDT